MTTTTKELNKYRVVRIFSHCYNSRSKDRIHVHGYGGDPGLARPAMDNHRGEIGEMLLQLPEQFMGSEGGDLEEARFRADGTKWADGHITFADRLMMLGDALGYIEYIVKPMRRPVGARGGRKPVFRVLADKIRSDLGTT